MSLRHTPASAALRAIAMLAAAGVAPVALAEDPAAAAPPPAAATGPAQVSLEASEVRGNQELPKVLYIVPWKDPAMVAVAGRPVNSLVDEALAPVDRDVFRRQGRYFEQLYGAGRGQQPEQPAGTGNTPRD
jgi:hypothetical protein